jgi:hypothetical protein
MRSSESEDGRPRRVHRHRGHFKGNFLSRNEKFHIGPIGLYMVYVALATTLALGPPFGEVLTTAVTATRMKVTSFPTQSMGKALRRLQVTGKPRGTREKQQVRRED